MCFTSAEPSPKTGATGVKEGLFAGVEAVPGTVSPVSPGRLVGTVSPVLPNGLLGNSRLMADGHTAQEMQEIAFAPY
jgi:hypothetical protein